MRRGTHTPAHRIRNQQGRAQSCCSSTSRAPDRQPSTEDPRARRGNSTRPPAQQPGTRRPGHDSPAAIHPGDKPRITSAPHATRTPYATPDTSREGNVMAWHTSDRRHRLPKDWPAIVSRIKARDQHRCQASRHDPRCDGRGTDVDHIIQGDNHSDDNLQLLNEHCHRAKTADETAARNRLNAKLRRRPEEDHPGRL